MSRSTRLSLLALLVVVLAGVAGIFVSRSEDPESQRTATIACTPEAGEDEVREEEEREERERERRAPARGSADVYGGPPETEPPCGERPGLPEPFADLARMNSSVAARSVAPGTDLRPGAYRAAVRAAGDLPTAGGDWEEYGRAPLETGRTEYDVSDESTQLGLGNVGGRLTAFAHDPATGRLFTAGSNAGVWTSTDGGKNWTSIGDTLPTQTVAGIAWTSAGGGALLVLTGDGAFAGSAYTGMGAYRTTDLGQSWQRADGVPDAAIAFKLVVDPNDETIAYAATGAGLFRSTDAGRSYVNVNLPTGEDAPAGTPDCSGKPPTDKNCFLANMVTDVVVQYPDNAQTDGDPGAVLAAVGWRRGTFENADGSQQAPGNGIYRSDDGTPGSFVNVHIEDNNVPLGGGDSLNKDQLGRIELGVARGPEQDHQYVYAIVQDAVKFNGGAGGLDVSEQGVPNPSYLNAIWVSPDFGKSEGANQWRELDGANTMSNDPTRNSALTIACQAPIVLYCPGVQAWYNLWVEPDPTQADASGVPTRLAFGLEEVWADDPTIDNPLDGSSTMHAQAVGRYYAGNSCGILLVLNELPACPGAPGGDVPDNTTHPDQHGALWVPDGSGGVTLHVANDGGTYQQHLAAGEDLSNDNWGTGANGGLHTLQPYDLAIARDGTVYMGLQDNGEAKIDPDGRSYTVFGGDGFFSGVDPDNPDIAYEEYTNGVIAKTRDGGRNWEDITPDNLVSAQFSTPFEMDGSDARHLVIGGRDIEETTIGPDTESGTWTKVYDLGTREHPGDPDASVSGDDADNQLSAVDTETFKAAADAPTGPHTPDVAYTGGGSTAPGGQENPLVPGQFPPGTYEDHDVTLAGDAGNASMTVRIQWASDQNDWDLYVYRRGTDDSLEEVGSSAEGGNEETGGMATDFEQVVVPNPQPGAYVVRVVNFTASGTFDGRVSFAQRTAENATTSPTYVGFCGFCDTITQGTPFGNGVATNVGGDGVPVAGRSQGWHIARASGLPRRLITSIRMDPSDPQVVYATLAGYARRWAAPGAVGDDLSGVGSDHVFKSVDAGETFVDVSGDLPDVPADWSVLHDGKLVVGTDVGVFISCDTNGGAYARLGRGLPNVPVSSLRFRPGHPDELFVATFGRGVYTYTFHGNEGNGCKGAAPAPPNVTPVPAPPATPCAPTRGFASVRVRQVRRGLRFAVRRRLKAPFTVDVFRESVGRRVLTERRVAHIVRRTRSFTWRGARRAGNGFYFVRFLMRAPGVRDSRRIALRRVRGRFRVRPGFHALRRCKLIRFARLTRPVFGGRTRRPLRVAAALSSPGTLTVVVRRGRRVVARKTFRRAGTGIRRFRVRPRALRRRVDYRVTVTGRAGTVSERVTLTARRL